MEEIQLYGLADIEISLNQSFCAANQIFLLLCVFLHIPPERAPCLIIIILNSKSVDSLFQVDLQFSILHDD